MTSNDYQKTALQYQAPKRLHMASEWPTMALAAVENIPAMDEQTSILRLLEGLMGLNGEAGEAIDIMKKVLFQGHKFDRRHVALELGDICWYLALAADAIGYDLEEIMQMNIDKLSTRYPNGFAVERSVNREEGDL